MDKDGLGSGVSDPYAMLTVGATSHRAATIRDNLNPEWNDHFDFPIEVSSGLLHEHELQCLVSGCTGSGTEH